MVARYGGDELLVVLPGTHFAGSVLVAERIWRESNLAPRSPDDARPLAVSIGVALYPSRDVRSKDALLRGADSALAQAKREGGHRVCVFQQQGYIYTPSLGSMNSAGVVDSYYPAPAAPPAPSDHGLRDAQDRGRQDP